MFRSYCSWYELFSLCPKGYTGLNMVKLRAVSHKNAAIRILDCEITGWLPWNRQHSSGYLTVLTGDITQYTIASQKGQMSPNQPKGEFPKGKCLALRSSTESNTNTVPFFYQLKNSKNSTNNMTSVYLFHIKHNIYKFISI